MPNRRILSWSTQIMEAQSGFANADVPWRILSSAERRQFAVEVDEVVILIGIVRNHRHDIGRRVVQHGSHVGECLPVVPSWGDVSRISFVDLSIFVAIRMGSVFWSSKTLTPHSPTLPVFGLGSREDRLWKYFPVGNASRVGPFPKVTVFVYVHQVTRHWKGPKLDSSTSGVQRKRLRGKASPPNRALPVPK